jgi:hypothetical protein
MGMHPYHLPLPDYTANSAAISGDFLARNQESRVVRAFFAADLRLGARRLENLTRLQAASLARVSPTYAYWAEKRLDQRAAIEAGLIPLVPAQLAQANGTPLAPVASAPPNGNGTERVEFNGGINDAALVHIAHLVGADRMLAAAVAVENGH